MKWTVVKLGREMFDAAHVYGLGIVLAYMGQNPVLIEDWGATYALSSSVTNLNHDITLEQILRLPTTNQLDGLTLNKDHIEVPIANLDGLLALLFTVPGVRLTSISDMLHKNNLKTIQNGLHKVNREIARRQQYLQKRSHPLNEGWLLDALQDYHLHQPTIPFLAKKGGNELTLPMTLDPSFGYSNYQPLSDGLISHKKNLVIKNMPYAAIFALIGAARFLRAQRVAGELVNLYLPLAHSTVLHPEKTMPILPSVSLSPTRAILQQWLTLVTKSDNGDVTWRGLAYQTLQTQGARQSISVDRGYLDSEWLASIKHKVGSKALNYWKMLLQTKPGDMQLDSDNLADCLIKRSSRAWFNHLYELALYAIKTEENIRLYKIREVKEITKLMDTAEKSNSLSRVVRRNVGTVRFGRALRLLTKIDPSIALDLTDYLDRVQNRDMLIGALGRIGQECKIAWAENKYIFVPEEEDFSLALDDCNEFGPQTVAKLIIALSALWYPRVNNSHKKHSPRRGTSYYSSGKQYRKSHHRIHRKHRRA